MNDGRRGAMRLGYRYAQQHGYDVAIQVDADGQHDPAYVPALLERLAVGDADLVIGARFAGDGDYTVRGPRKWAMSLLSVVLSRITRTKPEYLVLMGCDDLMHPNYLRVVRAAADREPAAAMIQPGVQVIGTDGLPYDTLGDRTKRKLYAPKGPGRALLGGEELATSLLRGNWLYFPSICWRTEAIKRFGFRADLGVIQDLALVVDLLVAGESLATTPEVCFSYRRHAASESSAKAYTGHRFEEAKRFFVETADRLDRHGWPRAAKVSRLHLSSRLHALTLLPGAAKKAGRPGVSAMLRHATR